MMPEFVEYVQLYCRGKASTILHVTFCVYQEGQICTKIDSTFTLNMYIIITTLKMYTFLLSLIVVSKLDGSLVVAPTL